jgi:hypothetical protein
MIPRLLLPLLRRYRLGLELRLVDRLGPEEESRLSRLLLLLSLVAQPGESAGRSRRYVQ